MFLKSFLFIASCLYAYTHAYMPVLIGGSTLCCLLTYGGAGAHTPHFLNNRKLLHIFGIIEITPIFS